MNTSEDRFHGEEVLNHAKFFFYVCEDLAWRYSNMQASLTGFELLRRKRSPPVKTKTDTNREVKIEVKLWRS